MNDRALIVWLDLLKEKALEKGNIDLAISIIDDLRDKVAIKLENKENSHKNLNKQ